jgi:hypothetical protein
MKIRVTFFKLGGKFYETGIVDVGDARLFNGGIPQAIVNNQQILVEGWQGHYHVVVENDHELTPEESVAGEFCLRLFDASVFRGMLKTGG